MFLSLLLIIYNFCGFLILGLLTAQILILIDIQFRLLQPDNWFFLVYYLISNVNQLIIINTIQRFLLNISLKAIFNYKLAQRSKYKFSQNNPFKLYSKLQKLFNKIRNNPTPHFVEIETYRYLEHCGPNDDTKLGYRSLEEVKKWKKIQNQKNKKNKRRLRIENFCFFLKLI